MPENKLMGRTIDFSSIDTFKIVIIGLVLANFVGSRGVGLTVEVCVKSRLSCGPVML
jgi:hypothetical protein